MLGADLGAIRSLGEWRRGGIAVAAASEFMKPYVLSVDDREAPMSREITLDASTFGFDARNAEFRSSTSTHATRRGTSSGISWQW